MGKKYIMFVDERGFISTNKKDTLSMVGVVFEYDYCIELKNIECELRTKLNKYREEIFSSESCSNISIDNVVLQEKVYKNIDKIIINKFINELPMLFKKLKFTIISSAIKQDSSKTYDSYSIATKKLLREFHSFIMKKNGESGGIIIEDKGGNASYDVMQNFFDIYNDRNIDLNMVGDIQDKINTFIVCEKSNKQYGLGIEVLNIVNSILFRVSNGYREIDEKLISYIEYGIKDKIFSEIKQKIYNDIEIGISSDQLQGVSYNNVEIFNKELKTLKEQLELKNTKIEEKEKEINQLSKEIQMLTQQLEEVLFNRKSDSIISRILSDIDVKVNGFDKVSTVAKN
jgi:hypothetical protein